MDEYLQHMKALRSQMNDVEDQAAKITAEEQMHLTNMRTLENDIDSAKSVMRKLREDAEKMQKAKGEICSQIVEKQRKSSSLESDLSTLAQTFELIQHERIGLLAKLANKR
ncbi:uncharacterized protein G2W53_023061 [Senna tora]|uniref:Uncharacterized protein n=1 Tax=Senna tora TaxID=362788 RepID=A0A834WJ99_9FABA|nr:uncharacterized protein G2W53_023061 [Senna tora]